MENTPENFDHAPQDKPLSPQEIARRRLAPFVGQESTDALLRNAERAIQFAVDPPVGAVLSYSQQAARRIFQILRPMSPASGSPDANDEQPHARPASRYAGKRDPGPEL